MKTILRIIVILLVAGIVAGGLSLAVNNSSVASDTNFEGGQPPVMTSADGQTITQPMERPEGGDEHGASLAGGLGGVLATIAKIMGITIVILLIQKVISLLEARMFSLAQR